MTISMVILNYNTLVRRNTPALPEVKLAYTKHCLVHEEETFQYPIRPTTITQIRGLGKSFILIHTMQIFGTNSRK